MKQYIQCAYCDRILGRYYQTTGDYPAEDTVPGECPQDSDGLSYCDNDCMEQMKLAREQSAIGAGTGDDIRSADPS